MNMDHQLTLGVGTDCGRLLAALQSKPGRFVPDLYRMNMMVHSRVADLRKQGHEIECKRFGHKDYRYRLVAREGGVDAMA